MDNSNHWKLNLYCPVKIIHFKYEIQCWYVSFINENQAFLSRILYIFLYLNIYTCTIAVLNGQNLELKIEAEKPISQSLKDSLEFNSRFENFASLQAESDSLQYRMQRLGYVDAILLNVFGVSVVQSTHLSFHTTIGVFFFRVGFCPGGNRFDHFVAFTSVIKQFGVFGKQFNLFQHLEKRQAAGVSERAVSTIQSYPLKAH